MMDFINKVFTRIEYERYKPRVNWFKTIYFNFRSLPITQAAKLPILIYGKCACLNLSGNIRIIGKVNYGCITIGLRRDNIRSYKAPSVILNMGTMILHRGCWMSGGVRISVEKSALLQIGVSTVIGDNTTIMCHKNVTIGNNCNIGYNNMIMDTDFHYTININTRECSKSIESILIGDNNWITNNITIKKGTKTPIGTIVAGPFSTLMKDYTELIPKYSIIAGTPAKLVKAGYRRVKKIESEILLNKYYSSNYMNTPYFLKEEIDIDDFCLPNNS